MTLHEFTNRPADFYEYHAFDIETTGLLATSEVTTLTLKHNDEYVVFARHPDGEIPNPSEVTTHVEDITGESITLFSCESQAALLTMCSKYVSNEFDSDTDIFTAYNGETYRGGFDLKVLRTAAIKEGIPEHVPFRGYLFTDAYEAIVEKDRINTTMVRPPNTSAVKAKWVTLAEMMGLDSDGVKDDVESRVRAAEPGEDVLRVWADEHNDGDIPTASVNGLGEVYELLTGQTVAYDEYDDSKEAIADFDAGNIARVIIHNVADVHMTDTLMQYVVATVPQADYKPKYL